MVYAKEDRGHEKIDHAKKGNKDKQEEVVRR